MKYLKTKLTVLLSIIQLVCWGQTKPNIIYILADDMGIGDVKAFNPNSKIQTPNIDLLAANGIKFTDAHTNSSVCTPTRYGILTGRYCWRTSKKNGVTRGLSQPLIPNERLTVASLLKQNGYQTACVGKWHLGMEWPTKQGAIAEENGSWNDIDLSKKITNGPNALGFDYYFGISASANHAPHCFIENDKIMDRGRGFKVLSVKQLKAMSVSGKKGLVEVGYKQSEILPTITRKACDWIAKQNTKEPFFLYLPLNSPHSPIVPSDEFVGKSGLSAHGDFCMQTDWAVGEIVKTLDRLQLTENTLVVFTSDNGASPQAKFKPMHDKGHFPSYIYRGLKGETFEGGHRVPFVVKWPSKISPNTQTAQSIVTTDFMATVAGLLNVKLGDNTAEDSESFLPWLNNSKHPLNKNRTIVHHSDAGIFAVRKGKWKLLLDNEGGSRRVNPKDKPIIDSASILLFDMEKDPMEQKNLSITHPEKVEELKKLLADLVANGRSTPGTLVSNDPMKKGKKWNQLKEIKTFLPTEYHNLIGK